LNTGRHLYLAGRPSRWALAHISSQLYFAQFSAAKFYCKGRHAKAREWRSSILTPRQVENGEVHCTCIVHLYHTCLQTKVWSLRCCDKNG